MAALVVTQPRAGLEQHSGACLDQKATFALLVFLLGVYSRLQSLVEEEELSTCVLIFLNITQYTHPNRETKTYLCIKKNNRVGKISKNNSEMY